MCFKTAPLNWEVAAIYPVDFNNRPNGAHGHISTFAHNVIGDNRVIDMITKHNYVPFQSRKLRKEYFDVPRNAGDSYHNFRDHQNQEVGSLDDLNKRAHDYWYRENANLLLYDYNPIKWRAIKFPAGKSASMADRVSILFLSPFIVFYFRTRRYLRLSLCKCH